MSVRPTRLVLLTALIGCGAVPTEDEDDERWSGVSAADVCRYEGVLSVIITEQETAGVWGCSTPAVTEVSAMGAVEGAVPCESAGLSGAFDAAWTGVVDTGGVVEGAFLAELDGVGLELPLSGTIIQGTLSASFAGVDDGGESLWAYEGSIVGVLER